MTFAAAHPHARLEQLLSEVYVNQLPADDPGIHALIQAYRDKFGLGPRNIIEERAEKFYGAKIDDRVIAVFGEKWPSPRVLEVTDAYHDDSREGLAAFFSLGYGYLQKLYKGEIDRLVHSILFANQEHWKAIIRETGDPPAVLVFIHERKG